MSSRLAIRSIVIGALIKEWYRLADRFRAAPAGRAPKLGFKLGKHVLCGGFFFV